MDKLLEKVIDKKVVIFDLYDVLLSRMINDQSDLFDYLEKICDKTGFAQSRVRAVEFLETQSENESIGVLDLIYDNMHDTFSKVKTTEVLFETNLIRVNQEMIRIYNEAVKSNIKVFIVGKFTLSTNQIEEVLKKNNISQFEKVIHITAKNTIADIIRNIIVETTVPFEDILYITSNDTVQDDSLNVSVVYYEPLYHKYGEILNSKFYALLNKYKNKDIMIPILQSLIPNRYVDIDDEWKLFGYKYFGLFAYEITVYIEALMSKYEISKLFLSSENCYLIKDAFDILFPKISTEIITYSSKQSLLSKVTNKKSLAKVLIDCIDNDTTFGKWYVSYCPSSSDKLYELYTEMFPDQDKIIYSEEDIAELKRFIIENEDLLYDESLKVKKEFADYLHEIGAFNRGAAIVDLSDDINLLIAIDNVSKLDNSKSALLGIYLDLQSKSASKLNISLINQITNFSRNDDYHYFYRIIKYLLSNPEKNASSNSVCRRVFDGATECINDLLNIRDYFQWNNQCIGVFVVTEYLQNYVSRSDSLLIEKAVINDNKHSCKHIPIFTQKRPVIGIANPWPQDVSAEAEVITRIKRAAEENNFVCVLLDSVGHILTDKQKATNEFVNIENVSFIITTHYECTKLLNAFYYNPLWNPPEIPLNLYDYETRVTNQFMMNDDFLIYDNGGMSNHLRAVLMNSPRTLKGVSYLTASFPKSSALEPKLDNPKMFYCGMNWEVMYGGAGRHDGLFRLLDDSGKVEIYGPERVEAWGGLRPWDGYQSYKGMIPFDGFSILDKINSCGICLVLSSDTHRRAGSATNRLYEACAAGAVIISDDNEFVVENFKDAALFITFNKSNPSDTFNQIMEKYDWIIKHPKESIALAKRAQEIFLTKYSLDEQLRKIVCNHPARLSQISHDLYARDSKGKVLVTFVVNTQKMDIATKWIDVVINNVHDQIYNNIELAIASDVSIAASLKEYCKSFCTCIRIVPVDLFDIKGVRKMTDGEAIRLLQKTISHDYYINTTADEIWFSDHITTLVRAISKEGTLCAYSGAAFEGSDGCRSVNFYDRLGVAHIYNMTKPMRPLAAGQFLFKSEAHQYLPDYLFGSIDGKEHLAYTGILMYKIKSEVQFTKRMSFCFSHNNDDVRGVVLNDMMQCHFIRDLIRFYIPEQTDLSSINTHYSNNESSSIADKKILMDAILYFPLKAYLGLRYYRYKMRKADTDTAKYKKYAARYDQYLEKYRQYWNA